MRGASPRNFKNDQAAPGGPPEWLAGTSLGALVEKALPRWIPWQDIATARRWPMHLFNALHAGTHGRPFVWATAFEMTADDPSVSAAATMCPCAYSAPGVVSNTEWLRELTRQHLALANHSAEFEALEKLCRLGHVCCFGHPLGLLRAMELEPPSSEAEAPAYRVVVQRLATCTNATQVDEAMVELQPPLRADWPALRYGAVLAVCRLRFALPPADAGVADDAVRAGRVSALCRLLLQTHPYPLPPGGPTVKKKIGGGRSGRSVWINETDEDWGVHPLRGGNNRLGRMLRLVRDEMLLDGPDAPFAQQVARGEL